MNAENIAAEMLGLDNVDDLPTDLQNDITQVNKLIQDRNQTGELRSTQVIALIIWTWQKKL